jgi:2'-5' RNA ligase
VRLFLALQPPTAAIAHLDGALGPVRAVAPELRWISPDRWHLTLAFLGEVPDDELDRQRRRVSKRLTGQSSFQLHLGGGGRFGERVLWVGVRGERDRLRSLAHRLDPAGRGYRPHLTLARARDTFDLRPVVESLREYDGPSWRAGSVLLVRSHLGPRPRYEDIAEWPLTRGGEPGARSGDGRPAG